MLGKNSADSVLKGLVEIPEGTLRVRPLGIDVEVPMHERENERSQEEFLIPTYKIINTLVIPSTLNIPIGDGMHSPFASYKQRPFVWNYPTECHRADIRHIENHSPHLDVMDGVLYSSDGKRLIFCFEKKTEFVVPCSVRSISPFAFCLQNELKRVILHDDIMSIGDGAFMGCSSLIQITIPQQVKQIPDDCFDGCTSLNKVNLPTRLERIGNCAFRQCVSLKNILLPEGLVYIRGFEGCSSLRSIDIPGSVEKIGGFMFCSSLRKVVLHEGTKRIDDYAFRFCQNLREINFPEGLEYIGDRSFYPSALKRLVFPDSLQTIGSEAFYHNRSLHHIEFQSKVAEIGQAAFACCPFLFRRNIRIPNDMNISDEIFTYDPGLDKYGFWD